MTRHSLILHPDFECDAVRSLDVEIARPGPGRLTLAYRLTGKTADLYLPALTTPARTDELWRRTCFEAFVRPAPGETYFEFNIAPSGQWATYGFSGYRADMASPAEAIAPRIAVRQTADSYELDVTLDLTALPGGPGDVPWRLGVSAVIEEEASGRKSYWALTHPPGKADFHHGDGFALEIPRDMRA
jgi:hypothetical protein